jgi:protein-disulfide isomerase
MADSNDSVTISKNNLLVGALAVLSVFSFYLWNKVQKMEKVAGTNTEAKVNNQAAPQAPTELKLKKPDPSKDHFRGDKNAKIVMVEYSDYECPFCQTFNPTAERILEENKGRWFRAGH